MTSQARQAAKLAQKAANIEDLRRMARRRVPRVFFDYLDGGAHTERTLRANYDDLQKIELRQRALIDVSKRSAQSTILGTPSRLPIALAPVGLQGLFHADGEILACSAAQAAGIPYCLSAMSICPIEDLAASVEQPFWFQLHLMKDRGFVKSLVERAIAARCSALFVTVDLPVFGQRYRDMRNGMAVRPRLGPRFFFDIAMRPGWALGMAGTRHRTFGNIMGHAVPKGDMPALFRWLRSQYDTQLGWNDIEWLAGIWPGKLVVKGILDAEDAVIASRTGAAAIVVSNHGGRQLDGAPSTVSMLPAIADAVGGATEILFDGGIRSGIDVMRALALGADACLLGRAYAYGLGAGGRAGVSHAIEIIRREFDTVMAMTGANSVSDIGRHHLVAPPVAPPAIG